MKYSGYIHAGWLIDGSGGPIKKNILLHIKNDRIHDIQKVRHNLPALSAILDLSSCTILPCLIDSHSHLSMSGTIDQNIRKNQLDLKFKHAKNVITNHLIQNLFYGVSAVRDGGDNKAHVLRYKKKCLDVEKIPIVLKAAGSAWHKPGRYGKFAGRVQSDTDTIEDAILKDKGGFDHIKIINSGLNSLTEFGKKTLPQFSTTEMRKVAAAAKNLGCKIMVHANGKTPVGIAIEAGCHSIEHGYFMGKTNLKKIADNDITWVPTAIPMKACSDYLKSIGEKWTIAEKNLDHQLEQIFQAREIGVRVAIGTDSGSFGVNHGISVIEEIKLLMIAGFSIQEAIKCASYNGARLLDMQGLGRLKANRPASFIVAPGKPAELTKNLKKIKSIYLNGHRLDQEHLRLPK